MARPKPPMAPPLSVWGWSKNIVGGASERMGVLSGCCLAAVWLLYGCWMAAVWLLYGSSMAAVLLLYALARLTV